MIKEKEIPLQRSWGVRWWVLLPSPKCLGIWPHIDPWHMQGTPLGPNPAPTIHTYSSKDCATRPCNPRPVKSGRNVTQSQWVLVPPGTRGSLLLFTLHLLENKPQAELWGNLHSACPLVLATSGGTPLCSLVHLTHPPWTGSFYSQLRLCYKLCIRGLVCPTGGGGRRRMLLAERLYEIVAPEAKDCLGRAHETNAMSASPYPCSLTTERFDKHSLTIIGGLPHLCCLENGVTRWAIKTLPLNCPNITMPTEL